MTPDASVREASPGTEQQNRWSHRARWLLCLFLALGCAVLVACGNGGEPFFDEDTGVPTADLPPGDPVAFSLATFNVRNFFDSVDDPAHSDEVLSASAVTAKVKALGKAIRELNADVVALMEVENKTLLDRLNTEELSSFKYVTRLMPGADVRGINVALLSRFPVPKTLTHIYDRFKGVDGDFTSTYGFSRDCLEASIELGPGRILTLLVNHLAATDDAISIKRRHAQASQVRTIAMKILGANAQANLAVVGDLNDTPGSETLTLIENGDPPLFDLLTLVAAADRYTYIYSGKKEQIDYILVSPGLKTDYVDGTVRANHSSTFKATSDHYPVFARFNLQ